MEHFSSVKECDVVKTGPQIQLAAMSSDEKAIEIFLNFTDLKVAMDKVDKNSKVEVSFRAALRFKNVKSESKIDADQAHDLHTLRHALMSETGSRRKMFNTIS